MKLAPVLLVAVVIAACGGTTADSPLTTTPPSTTTTAPPTTTTAPTTTTTSPPPTTTAPEEVLFGELVAFVGEDGSVTVTIGLEEMLSGDEAVAAAREDGVIGDGEDLPNDYYIRNLDEELTLPVSPDVSVVLQACYPSGPCVTEETVDLDTWSLLLGAEEDPGLDWEWYGAGYLPYWWHVTDGTVTLVQEQYLP